MTIIETLDYLKRKDQRMYIETIIDILDKIDFDGVELLDWELVVLKQKLELRQKELLMPNSVRIQTFFNREI